MALTKLFIYDDKGHDVELGGVDSFKFKVYNDWRANFYHDVAIRDAIVEVDFEWTTERQVQLGDDITYRGSVREIEVKDAGFYVEEGSYFPEHLGLNLPGVNWIHVGRCSQKANEGYEAFGTEVAHAHHEIGEICFAHGTYVFSAPGIPDDVLIHEYCHVLANQWGHGPLWAIHMWRYGLDDYPLVTYAYQ